MRKALLGTVSSVISIFLALCALTAPLSMCGCGEKEHEEKALPAEKELVIPDFPTKSGSFKFASFNEENGDIEADYFYTDGAFFKNADNYDAHLATMSLCLAMAGFNSNLDGANGKYDGKASNLVKLLCDIGFDEENIKINDFYSEKPTEDSIGVAVAVKNIDIEDRSFRIVPIVIRGSGYEAEWASNFHLGSEGDAAGFSEASTKAISEITSFLKEHGIGEKLLADGSVKFWVVGYSRGAAVANLTAGTLIDLFGKGSKKYASDVFAYCFECPQGAECGFDGSENKSYNSIHNIINYSDPVPLVAPSSMGFTRLGTDHYIPGGNAEKSVTSVSEKAGDKTVFHNSDNTFYDVGSDGYEKLKSEMLKKLEAIDPDTASSFEDTLSPASVSLVGYVLGKSDLVIPISDEIGTTPGAFLRDFFDFLAKTPITDRNEYVKDHLPFLENFNTESILRFVLNSYFKIEGDVLDVLVKYLPELRSRATDSKYGEIFGTVIEGLTKDGSKNENLAEVISDLLIYFSDGAISEKNGDAIKLAIETILAITDGKIADGAKNIVYDAVDSQVLIGTLVKNADKLTVSHYPEVNLAWLQCFDDNYR